MARALADDDTSSAANSYNFKVNSEAFFYKLDDMEFAVKMATKALLQDSEKYILCLETSEISLMSVLLSHALRNLQKGKYSNPVFTDFHNFIKIDKEQNGNNLNLIVCKVDIDDQLEQYSEILTSWARLVKDKSKKIIFVMKNAKYLEQITMKTKLVNVLKIKFTELWEEYKILNNYDQNQENKESSENLLLPNATQMIKPIEILKLHGIDILAINTKDKEGNTPLHVAASQGQNKLVKALLDYDVPKDLKNKNGYTPLHLATSEGYLAVVSTLLENDASVNATDSNKLQNALHKACMSNDTRLIKLLLRFGAAVETQTKAGCTALHLASVRGHNAAVTTLLLEYESNINAQNKEGNSSLHLAIGNNHQKVVLNLLHNGADVNLQNNWEKTALDQAKLFKRSTLIPIIAKYEALTKVNDQ